MYLIKQTEYEEDINPVNSLKVPPSLCYRAHYSFGFGYRLIFAYGSLFHSALAKALGNFIFPIY